MIQRRAWLHVLIFMIVPAGIWAQPGSSKTAFFIGADISFLPRLEASGVVYTVEGVADDLLAIIKRKGLNAVRLRLWHTPSDGRSDLTETLQLAQRIQAAGLRLVLDLHYSDTWADPGRQTKPAAWNSLTFDVLRDSVYQYSRLVIEHLSASGVTPAVVQIGNEIIQGLLWNDGRVGGDFDTPQQWEQLATLIRAGIDGVHDGLMAGDSTQIMIHIDRGGDVSGARWFFDHLEAELVEYDIIGLSYYPWWHGTLDEFRQTLNTVASSYQKPVIIAETAYPWTLHWFDNTNNIVGLPEHLLPGYPASPNGQYSFLRDVIQRIRDAPDGLGRGLFYWAPEYIAVEGVGSPWENVALFDADGEALAGLDAFQEAATVAVEKPEERRTRTFTSLVYPNPFSQRATLVFEMPEEDVVSIRLYGVDGSVKSVFINVRQFSAGVHRVSIDGATLPAGVYFYEIETQKGFRSLGTYIRR